MCASRGWIRVAAVCLVLLSSVTALASDGLAQKPGDEVGSSSDISGAATLSEEIRVSPAVIPNDYNNYRPDVAYNSRHRQFLIVWHRTRTDGCREIWARRVTESGQRLGHFSISTGPCPQNRLQPAVVYNSTNDEYLVVWMYNPSGTGLSNPNEIWARTVKWDGSSMGPERQAIVWFNRSFWSPRVAWNSLRNEYMVVWNANDTATGMPNDVAYAILNKDGVRVYGSIISTYKAPHQVDVAYNVAKGEYGVVWRGECGHPVTATLWAHVWTGTMAT